MLVNKKLAFCTVGERIHLCNIILCNHSEARSSTEQKKNKKEDENGIEEHTSLISSIVCDLNGILAKVFIFRFNKS